MGLHFFDALLIQLIIWVSFILWGLPKEEIATTDEIERRSFFITVYYDDT